MKTLETEIVKMKDLSPGDKIIGPDGKPTVISEVFEEHIPERMYKIEMEDGQIVECSGNHLWYCETDTDKREKKRYSKSAKRYFKKEVIPKYDELGPAYPIDIMSTKFSDDMKCREFIKRACLSLGPTVTTPNIAVDNYLEVVNETLVYLYSFNDMIDFLHEMKRAITNNSNGYFYFGKVRTTDEIFSIIDENINIPEKGDIIHGKN